ncbi:uncharacterized protein [Drosophila virilis]|uniref:uncharacterized protein n=1 Tax=Drosophila virilis TaxID=7244 RepID=UPI0038B3B554
MSFTKFSYMQSRKAIVLLCNDRKFLRIYLWHYRYKRYMGAIELSSMVFLLACGQFVKRHEKAIEKAVSMEISVRSEIAKRVSILPCSTFRDQSVLPSQTVRAKAPPTLPSIKLPTFSDGYTEWADFYYIFTTVIENHPDLADIEKLQHLRSCLKDTALDAIRSLEITNDNYTIALNLLEKRFNNRRLVFQAHILEILGFKRVAGGSAVSLRQLSDQFNAHFRALKGMGNSEQIAGCIIVQIILQKLDPISQAKWEERLEDSSFVNLIPSWEHMATFLEQRCRTMETANFAMDTFGKSLTIPSYEQGHS